MITAKKYNISEKESWDQFVESSKNGTFLFKRDFMDYHSERYDDSSLMIYKDSKLIGLFPCNIDENIIHSHQGLTYGGIIVDNEIKFAHFLEIFNTILKYFFDIGYIKILIKQIPKIYISGFNDEIDYFSYVSDGKLYRKDMISVIDLQKKFKISNDRIQGYKRGLKNKLKFLEVDMLDDFWKKILIPTLSSKHSVSPVHTLKEISLLKNNFKRNIRQFNVYHNDKIVAGTTIFQTKNVIHVQYIGSDLNKNRLGSIDFLFYNLITDTFSEFNFFDFGTSNESNGKKINSGLLYWKEGYGARTHTQDFYEILTSSFNKLNDLFINPK